MKENFKTLGNYDEDAESGYITRGLDSAIKMFQRDNNLKVDGRINPRGETESRIFDVLENGLTKIGEAKPKPTPQPQAPSGRSSGIGFGTGQTDFMIERDEETPDASKTGRFVFVPEAPKPKPREPYV